MNKKILILGLSIMTILSGCGNKNSSSFENSNTGNSSIIESSSSSISTSDTIEQVVDYMLDDERKYTGQLVNGLPEGEGILTWVKTNCVYTGEFKAGAYHGEGLFEWKNNGDSLKGTFENGNPINGKFTYKNTMSYTGEFNESWQFHGKGTFDWNMYNSSGDVTSYGWLYEGEFKNGTMIGCVGKITFTVARNGSNGQGCYWYEGLMAGFPGVAVGQYGKGFIKYGDGSTYEGDVYVQNANSFIRQGKGVQNFETCTTLSAVDFGASHEYKVIDYVGEFDGLSHGWMFGNGVVYFEDLEGNPAGYIKGSWNGTTRTGDWVGTWSNDILKEEYRETSEISYKDAYGRKLDGFIASCKDMNMSDKTLLLGPSTFEFWETAEEDLESVLNVVNFGIGGSGPIFWETGVSSLSNLPSAPKNIIYYVGTNDIASRGETVEDSINKTKQILELLKELFPETNLYVVESYVATSRWNLLDSMMSLNSTIKEYCETNNIGYIETWSYLFDSSNTTGKYFVEGYGSLRTDIWVSDNLHLNSTGYNLFAQAFIDYFNALNEN